MSFLAVNAIMTNGLTCGASTACQGGTLITAGPFSLFCGHISKSSNTTGGGAVYNARPIPHRFTKASVQHPDQSNETLIPFNPLMPHPSSAPVTIRTTYNGKTTEKIFMVPINSLPVMIKVINAVNKTTHGISITYQKVKKINHRIVVKVKSIRFFNGFTK